MFFLPSANCADLVGVSTPMRIVSDSTLEDTINSLDALVDPATEALVQGCS